MPPFISSAAPRARHGISVSAQSTPARGQAPRRHAEAQWGAPALESDPDAQTWVTARSRADLSGRTRQSSAISESEAWGVHSGWQEEWSGYLQGTASAQGVPWWESGGLAAASQGPRRPSRQQTYSTQGDTGLHLRAGWVTAVPLDTEIATLPARVGMLKLRAMVAQASHAERKGKGIHPSNFMGRVEGASAAQASKPKLTAEEIQAKIIAVIKEVSDCASVAGTTAAHKGNATSGVMPYDGKFWQRHA